MAEAVSELSKWIPVIGTLSGAALGFLASFSTAWFNQKRAENLSKANRERQRLEEIYRTLIDIRRDYQKILGQVISKIHYDEAFEKSVESDIPPLVKLEMILSLYFPELKSFHRELVKSIHAFGNEYAKVIVKRFHSESLQEKQALCGNFVSLFTKIDDDISSVQNQVAKLIES